tara:strand:- start:12510 stop:13292 length:783 start_codon:yes stop_codon:yes gene_type:complete
MIIANLKGGLGNQLFQIAAGFAAAKRAGDKFAINYNLPHNLVQGGKASRYRETLYKDIPATDAIPNGRWFEPHFHYAPIPSSNDQVIDGYFQSGKHFDDCAEEIKELFKFPQEIKDKVDRTLETLREGGKKIVTCHVRRGDYLIYSNIHPPTPPEYYENALEGLGDIHTLLCTDDIQSVEKEFDMDRFVWANSPDELHDLYLLSQSDVVIMSNSSFAWWGAFLGIEKKVFAPSTWFGEEWFNDTNQRTVADIYNKDWTII